MITTLISVNNNLKSYCILAGVVSFWLVLLLVLIAPFDASDLSPVVRIILMPMYGVIFFISYMLGYVVQIIWHKQSQSWNVFKEFCTLTLIYLFTFSLSWVYYKTDWINGDYDLYTFGINVFLPIGLILSIGIIFGRYYLNKRKISITSDKITLIGNNQKEILKLNLSQIISVSGAQNYVDINVLEANTFKKIVFRNTLKDIHMQCPELIKVHRSYLINPLHFTRWKDNNTAIFCGQEIPISKAYKKELENRISQNP